MTARSSSSIGRLRSGALLLGVWIGFFALQPGVSLVLAKHGPANLSAVVENDLVLAVLWAALSAGIAAWHRRVRAIATNVFTVVALHVPALVLAALIDT